MGLKQQAEQNRHMEAMQKLAVDMLKAKIQAQQVGLAAEELDHTKTIDHMQLDHDKQVHVDGVNQDAMQSMVDQDAAEQDRQFQAEQGEADRDAKGGLTGT
jgi:peptide deformylase